MISFNNCSFRSNNEAGLPFWSSATLRAQFGSALSVFRAVSGLGRSVGKSGHGSPPKGNVWECTSAALTTKRTPTAITKCFNVLSHAWWPRRCAVRGALRLAGPEGTRPKCREMAILANHKWCRLSASISSLIPSSANFALKMC